MRPLPEFATAYSNRELALLAFLTLALLIVHPLVQSLFFGLDLYFIVLFICCDRLPTRFMGLLALGGMYVDVLSMRPIGISILEILGIWTMTVGIHMVMPRRSFYADWLIFGLFYATYCLIYLFVIPVEIHPTVPLRYYYGLSFLLTLTLYPFLIQLYAACHIKPYGGRRIYG